MKRLGNVFLLAAAVRAGWLFGGIVMHAIDVELSYHFLEPTSKKLGEKLEEREKKARSNGDE